jgi:hypothetical protein
MKRATRFYFFNFRLLIGLLVLFAGAILGMFAKANPKALTQGPARYLRPFPSGGVQEAWVARYGGDEGLQNLRFSGQHCAISRGRANRDSLLESLGPLSLPFRPRVSPLQQPCTWKFER